MAYNFAMSSLSHNFEQNHQRREVGSILNANINQSSNLGLSFSQASAPSIGQTRAQKQNTARRKRDARARQIQAVMS
jgi:hypothetical protein